MSRNRNTFWDAVRGVLMLIVVFAHALQLCNGMTGANHVLDVIRLFQMVALFFVSGYVAAYSSRFDFRTFVAAKTRRLVVPHVVWIALMWVAVAVFSDGRFHPADLLRSFLYSEFWFLRTLFLVFVCFACSRCLEGRSYVAAGVAYLFLAHAMTYIPRQGVTFHYALYFAAGYLLHRLLPFEITVGGLHPLSWVGRNALAIYAVHWNLLFAYFPYDYLGLKWFYAGSASLYVRSIVLFILWMVVTITAVVVYDLVVDWLKKRYDMKTAMLR